MTDLDPRAFHVESQAAAIREREQGFEELMAEQIRHAPWVATSMVLHAILIALLWGLIRPEQVAEDLRIVQLQPADQTPPPVEIPPPPEEKVEIEDLDIEPTLEPTDEPVDVPVDDVEATDELSAAQNDSSFDSTAWNAAVGLAGGAGGKYAKRGNRGGGGGRRPSPSDTKLDNALRWLAAHQDENGQWDCDEFMKHDVEGAPCDGAGASVHDVGVTGLALLSFLGNGSTMAGGPYRDTVKRGVLWLLDQQDPETGLIGRPSSNEFVYDHAIATLAIVEAVGLSRYRLMRRHAQRALEYLEYHRNPYGVWRYQPRDGDNDTSVTGWAVLAYKSAQDFDFDVNEQALDYAANWFDTMTDDNGRVGYNERGGRSSRKVGDHATEFPREKGECMTAVALMCRFFLGQTPDATPSMDQHASLIAEQMPRWAEDGSIDHYYWYYGSYALFQYGGREWNAWRKAVDNAVVKTQRDDGNFKGSWDPIGAWGHDGGRVYSTAVLALTLQAHYRYTRLIR